MNEYNRNDADGLTIEQIEAMAEMYGMEFTVEDGHLYVHTAP